MGGATVTRGVGQNDYGDKMIGAEGSKDSLTDFPESFCRFNHFALPQGAAGEWVVQRLRGGGQNDYGDRMIGAEGSTDSLTDFLESFCRISNHPPEFAHQPLDGEAAHENP